MKTLESFSKQLGLDGNTLCVYKKAHRLQGKSNAEIHAHYVNALNEQRRVYDELSEIYYEITNFSRLGEFMLEKGLFTKRNSIYMTFAGCFPAPERLIGKTFLDRRKELLRLCKEFLKEERMSA